MRLYLYLNSLFAILVLVNINIINIEHEHKAFHQLNNEIINNKESVATTLY